MIAQLTPRSSRFTSVTGTFATLTGVIVCNNTASTALFTIRVGNTNLYSRNSVAAYSTEKLDFYTPLDTGGLSVSVRSHTARALSFTVMGT